MASHATGDGGIPPRDAAQRGLKRIMTLGGAYGTRNYTVKHLRDQKGKRVLVETLPFTTEEAAAAEEAGIDTMKVRFDPRQPEPAAAIRRGRAQHVHSLLGAAARRRYRGRGGAARLRRHGGRGGRDHVPVEPPLHRRGDRGGRPRSGTRGSGPAQEHLDRGIAGGRQDPRRGAVGLPGDQGAGRCGGPMRSRWR